MTDPKWLTLARTFNDLREVPGPASNPTILGWLGKLKAWWKEDATPWCGTFVAYTLQESGLPIIKEWYRAKAWATYGSNLRPDRLAPGAILVFGRDNGGHVGYYVGEDQTSYHVFGGNQSDKVCRTRILKTRLIASRWPAGVPVIGGPVLLNTVGGPISRNEA